MLKSMNKKKLSLLFAVVALVWCGPLSSMKKVVALSGSCKKLPTGTTIIDLPDDCLCEILQFYADDGGKKTAELRCVSKDFKRIIDEDKYPCYFVCINGKKQFLPYRLVKKNGSFSNISLWKHLCSGNDCDDYHGDYICAKNHKDDHVDSLIFGKKDISNSELNMFGEVLKKLIVSSENFGTSKIKWPEGFEVLEIVGKNFNLKYLTGLEDRLKHLTLFELEKFDGNEFPKLKKLESLSVKMCEKFYPEGLEKLEKLSILKIDNYGKVVGKCSPKAFKNLYELEICGIAPQEGKIEEKVRKILNVASKCNLYRIILDPSYHDKETIKKSIKKGCRILKNVGPITPQMAWALQMEDPN